MVTGRGALIPGTLILVSRARHPVGRAPAAVRHGSGLDVRRGGPLPGARSTPGATADAEPVRCHRRRRGPSPGRCPLCAAASPAAPSRRRRRWRPDRLVLPTTAAWGIDAAPRLDRRPRAQDVLPPRRGRPREGQPDARRRSRALADSRPHLEGGTAGGAGGPRRPSRRRDRATTRAPLPLTPGATSSTSSSCTCSSIRDASPSAAIAVSTFSIATLMTSAAEPWIGALSAIRSAISRRCRLSLVRSGR